MVIYKFKNTEVLDLNPRIHIERKDIRIHNKVEKSYAFSPWEVKAKGKKLFICVSPLSLQQSSSFLCWEKRLWFALIQPDMDLGRSGSNPLDSYARIVHELKNTEWLYMNWSTRLDIYELKNTNWWYIDKVHRLPRVHSLIVYEFKNKDWLYLN